MKKKLGIAIGAMVGAVVLGLGIYQSDASQANPELSTDEILQMVTDQYPGTITEMEMEKDGNRAVYEVEIENDGKEYEIKLDGSSGEVLNVKEREISNNIEIAEKDDDADDRNDNQGTKTNNNNDSQDDGNNDENSSKTNNTVIDLGKAEEIALNEFDGQITELELDEDDGRLMYEIEIEDGEDEAEIEIDAYTGEILVIEIDREDD
ncbi:putative membrane protein YkoI [Virgibacillus natechei]|uniref:Membrane protein YkoI n=2 Tax=Virgibacillus natechei TaxID=1216297 RepID=A0ABS4ICI0_9BACI|nr:PepSY domain-containing protein [Virgibacillus natechei]MBP1968639.1 putative membrane protein YkoI [Virgibacillus natechei]UZD13744.1 PepSY domain-containing protein [Virgibacillus natechei]